MSQAETTQKTMNEERWNTVMAPVEAWVDNFTPVDEDEEDRLELVQMQLRRGNRSPKYRAFILKQFRLEFAEEIKEGKNGFDTWQRKHLWDGPSSQGEEARDSHSKGGEQWKNARIVTQSVSAPTRDQRSPVSRRQPRYLSPGT